MVLIGGLVMASNGPELSGQGPQDRDPGAQGDAAQGDRGAVGNPAEEAGGNLNIPFPTLGGKQFWTDWIWRDGWRIQQNALSEHWRLICPRNIRRAWGSREACERELRARLGAEHEDEADERIVVLLHGLMRSASSMSPLAESLRKAGVERPVAFEYASTRRSIAHHATALRYWLEHLPGRPRIDFVAHSMGNIVVRHLIADLQRDGDPQALLPRMGKMVMLGPPNQGSDVARQLGRLGLFEVVTGQGGMELGPAWDAFQHRLAVPPIPFMIVAGDLQESWIKNPLVDGPSDLVVGVEEANLEGAETLHRVPVLHSFLMNESSVQERVAQFLR